MGRERACEKSAMLAWSGIKAMQTTQICLAASASLSISIVSAEADEDLARKVRRGY